MRENGTPGEILARVPQKKDISNKTVTLNFRDVTLYSLTTKCLSVCMHVCVCRCVLDPHNNLVR